MTTKLTLCMDSKVIESAKKYAQKKGISLSKIVEEYLGRVTARRISRTRNSLMEIKGILGPLPAEFDYKKEVRDRVY